MQRKKYLLLFIALILVILIWSFFSRGVNNDAKINEDVKIETEDKELEKETKLGSPISDAEKRVLKKPFGIYVSPKDSPVSPEKFTGYHSGVDFEAFENEKDKDVEVKAICSGKIERSEFGRGYGGMVVESCTLDGNPIVVTYGHIDLKSVTKKVGASVEKGEFIAFLGEGYTSETDGERKHLHLNIHKGKSINTSGYVGSPSELGNFINVLDYIAN